MSIPRSFRLSAAALLLGGVSQSHAAFQAVDNFNTLTNGTLAGQNGWMLSTSTTGGSAAGAIVVAADPSNAANKVLQLTANLDAYKPLPASIPDASTGTLFFRVRITDLANDVSFGLSDIVTPNFTDFPNFEVQGNATNTDGRFGTRDGGANQAPLFNMIAGVWYNVWYVVNTTTDTFTLHVQSDGHAAYAIQTQINAPDGTWNFRNAAAANPITTFLVLSNNDNTGLLIDDIYVDPAASNLTNPSVGNDDTDSDGLSDTWERFYFNNSLAEIGSGDYDSDGASNEAEETAGSEPNNAASTPLDTDADGLRDDWETTHFGNKTSQNGAGDADGDGATNEQEETAVTSPVNAGQWPNADDDGLRDAWELLYFPDLATAAGSGDADGDGASNLAEMQAGSNPNSSASTPSQPVLAHRWSFNGDLNDSVGTSHATLFDLDNNPATGGGTTLDTNAITLAGGASATSTAVRLGGNLIGGRTTPVTIELWATNNAVQNWGRIFDFGSGTTEYLFMSFVRGTDTANDQVEWRDSVSTNRGTTNATSYALGAKYHVVLTLTPAAYTSGSLATGTRVTWYIAPANSATTVVAKGTFDTPNILANLNDVDNYLGRSMWPGDNVANATYDEFRIWNGVLPDSLINTYHLAGPNAFTLIDTDSDGLSDTWENTFFGNLAQGAAGDFDLDGFTNAHEYNSGSDPTVAASTPNDTDGDGLGDSWEITNFGNLSQTAAGDPDRDIATNLEEYLAGTDPDDGLLWPDTEDGFGDGLPDAWEMLHFGNLDQIYAGDPDDDGYSNGFEYENSLVPTNYLSSPDSDSDGLVDGWEIRYFKTTGETGLSNISAILPRTDGAADPDADGFTNALEFVFLTDPTSNTSVPGDVDEDGDNDGPMLKLGGDLINTESFTSGLNWHNGLAPLAGQSYIVAVNGLRTPATGDHTFVGDRIVLTTSGTNIGTLIWKTDGAVTIPVLQLHGGTINQAATNASTVTLNGSILITRDSTIFANNGNFLINSAISGIGDLTLTGNNVVTFAGANTSTGDLVVPAAATATANRLTLAPTGSIEFTLGATRVNNAITGAGAITLNGTFVIDSAAASSTLGDNWTLVATTGVKTYGTTFSVSGYSSDGAAAGTRKWVSLGSAPFFQFDEATGVLTVVTNPDSDNDGLLDSWEITHFGNLTATNGSIDSDNDGSTDAQELAAGTNPVLDTSWPDTDADGVKDTWEIATFGNLTTATITDKDGDTLLDTWELTYFASIQTQGPGDDSDGDTHSNATELAQRSNPALAASVPGDINADGIADGPRLLIGDSGGTSSFATGLNWSDAQAPVTAQNYMVDVTSLRTPVDAGAYTFAGDRLVLFTGGNLLVKGSGVLTFPLLQLDGGQLHNGTDTNVAVTVEGAVAVTRASGIFAQNQGFVINAVLSGSGNLTLSGAHPVTFAGANTWKGNLALTNTGGFVLAQTGALAFAPGASGVTNAITGTNPAVLNGTFHIDTTAASTTPGASWTLVATSGAKTYGATFAVSGYTADGAAAGARKWTSGAYVFDEATGVLSIPGTPLSRLASWRQTHFATTANTGTAADSADPDADGLANLLEYALGGDPLVSDAAGAVTTAVVGGRLTLTFDHIDDPTLTYVIEASDTLASWTTVATHTGLSAVGTITHTDTVTLGAGVRRFLRLKITPAAL